MILPRTKANSGGGGLTSGPEVVSPTSFAQLNGRALGGDEDEDEDFDEDDDFEKEKEEEREREEEELELEGDAGTGEEGVERESEGAGEAEVDGDKGNDRQTSRLRGKSRAEYLNMPGKVKKIAVDGNILKLGGLKFTKNILPTIAKK